MELKQTVIDSAQDIHKLISKYKFAYIVFECRTMKTATSLQSAVMGGFKEVLFVTTASGVKGVKNDYSGLEFNKYFNIHVLPTSGKHGVKEYINIETTNKHNLTVVAYTSLHKLDLSVKYDYKILDECHKIGANPRPKPSKTVEKLLKLPLDIPTILMSATPDTEGSGLVYYQCQQCKYSPFYNLTWKEWVEGYVNVKEINTGKFIMQSYKKGKTDKIDAIMSKYKLTKTQVEAGFANSDKTFRIITSQMNDKQLTLYKMLNKYNRRTLMNVKGGNVVRFKDGGYITIKSVASRNSKLHQISGGTLIVDKTKTEQFVKYLSNNKADSLINDFIINDFKKAVISYAYKGELELLCNHPQIKDRFTTDIDTFRETDIAFLIRQQTSIDTGVDLHQADAIYLYSFNYSATTYLQVIERICHVNKVSPNIITICITDTGIDGYIYHKNIKEKKSFSNRHYN